MIADFIMTSAAIISEFAGHKIKKGISPSPVKRKKT
jgi:hypothetical protein